MILIDFFCNYSRNLVRLRSDNAREHLKYRPDIDGLRAFAVLSVVLYHAFPSLLRGGFIGVDVFFVISGYLISSIIFKELSSGEFGFLNFYQRRVNRIFPALILVLVTCYLVGWFTLMATEFKMLSKHVAGGIGFIQNIILYRESGYFDTSSELKPLLHLWSLGVEEQFYIFFPIVCWIVWRSHVAMLPILFGVTLASFCAGTIALATNPSAAFYLPHYRFWEILSGSILAYCTVFNINYLKVQSLPFFRNICSWLGSVLLILSVILVNKYKAFPGFWAFLPVFGSVFMIMAGPQACINKYILSCRLMVWIGLISYPLYLWHWVVITYVRIIGVDELSILSGFFAVLLSVALAYVTYKFVELPFRKIKTKIPKFKILIFLSLAIFAVGIFSFIKEGFPYRPGVSASIKEREEYAQYFENSLPGWAYFTKNGIFDAYRADCDFFDLESYRSGNITMEPRKNIDHKCYIPVTNTKVMIFGDSHAQQYYYGLSKSLPSSVSILQVTSSGCEPNFASATISARKYCDRSNQFAFEMMDREKPDVLIMAQSELHDVINNLTELTAKAKSLGVKKVIVIGPVPHFDQFLYQVVARKYWNDTPRRIKTNLEHSSIETDAELKTKYSGGAGGFYYLSAMSSFCNDDGCITYLGDNRKTGLVTFDYGHLTPPASVFFAETALAPLIMKNLVDN